MELMARYPDKYFDLAIVDPPYGIDHANKAGKMAGQKYGNAAAKKKNYTAKDWDTKTPEEQYWGELFRVSKNQIIWGGNYFSEFLPSRPAWIVWDKDNGDNNFSDCELAWSSFNKGLRMFKSTWNGMIQHDMKNKQNRIHPTEKPYRLYKFCLENYAKPNDKILDTHLGSGSIAIACHDYGFDLTACELDKEYFDKAMQRINNHMAQTKLF
jgi:site-specific DNA-methyltransferase (adenine-specific)